VYPYTVLHHSHTLRWMNSGRRVRADGLVVVLVKKITPFVFSRRRLQGELTRLRQDRHFQFTGTTVAAVTPTKQPPLPYYKVDDARDARAQELFAAGKVTKVEFRADTLSALVVSEDLHRMRANPYVCRLWPWGDVMCTCVDFLRNGGYCKHMRAALLRVCGNVRIFLSL
jgi:hypothetical protein